MKLFARHRLYQAMRGRDLSFHDLVLVTGLKPATVVTGLYHLRLRGVLQTETLPAVKRGRPQRVYSVREVRTWI